jgi:hypothetical protein
MRKGLLYELSARGLHADLPAPVAPCKLHKLTHSKVKAAPASEATEWVDIVSE